MLRLNANAVRAALMIAGTKDARFYLNGLHIDPIGARSANLIATDGAAFLAQCITQAEAHGITAPVTLPRGAFDGHLGGASFVEIEEQGADTFLATVLYTRKDPLMLTVKSIDGRYPDYRRIIPAKIDKPASGFFNPEIAYQMHNAFRALSGSKTAFASVVEQGAKSPAIWTHPEHDALGLVMPMLGDEGGVRAADMTALFSIRKASGVKAA